MHKKHFEIVEIVLQEIETFISKDSISDVCDDHVCLILNKALHRETELPRVELKESLVFLPILR